jgi:hypothetical protein
MKVVLAKIIYKATEIQNKKLLLRKEFLYNSINIDSGEVKKISEEDLRILFELYDKYFFDSYFKDKFKGNIKFSLSKRMNKSAGKTIVPKNISVLSEEKQSFEIRIGVNFFFQYYDLKREKIVGGIITSDSLHALLTVFEHELIHFLEFYTFGKSSCKGKRFKDIAFNIFGHKDVYHSLPTNSEVLRKDLNISPGDSVCFSHDGKSFKGIIYRINKRATVMVLNNRGNYVDSKGNRFNKFYVPIQLLSKM